MRRIEDHVDIDGILGDLNKQVFDLKDGPEGVPSHGQNTMAVVVLLHKHLACFVRLPYLLAASITLLYETKHFLLASICL
jgi:hypothetical protein